MKKNIFITLLCILPMLGCTFSNVEDKFCISLNDSILNMNKHLCFDTVGVFKELIYADKLFVYRDSILIVQNRRHEDGFFIELYNMNTKKNIKSLYRLGDGPEEMLEVYGVAINKDTLYVNDFVKGQLALVNLDSLLCNSAYEALPIRHKVSGGVPTSVPYQGGFLVENPNRFINDELGINQDAPRFIVANGKDEYTNTNRYRYYTRNVAVNGSIITNYSNNRVVYAALGESLIEIYDAKLNLLKEIKGPVKINAKYAVEKNEEIGSVVHYDGIIPYGYVTYYADDDCFYLSYIGDYLRGKMEMRQLPGWIFKFDWDGNLINSVKVGHYVASISKCGENLYFTIIDDQDVPVLLKINEDVLSSRGLSHIMDGGFIPQ